MRAFLFAIALAACSGNPVPPPGGGGGGSSTGGGSGGGGSTGCSPACSTGRTCCSGVCVNTDNDPKNCGACGTVCSGTNSFCGGSCLPPPCDIDAGSCGGGNFCCGTTCCGAGDLCCQDEGPLTGEPLCVSKDAGTCPMGCAPLCVSDRDAKRDVRRVDEQQVLERVASMPYSTWSYNDDPTHARHLGPMAQDFREAFGLGVNERTYSPVDAHGVSFASIKALYELVQAQELRIERLEAENAALLKAGTTTCPSGR